MRLTRRALWPTLAGLAAMGLLAAVYFGIVSWAESPEHALDLFWQDRWIVVPILLGFGVQAALYAVLKLRLYLPVADVGPSGKLVGAGGSTSTVAMVACCAHHVTDALPLLGLAAAATFLAEYRLAFMVVGLATTLFGIGFMLSILVRERRRALRAASLAAEAA